MNLIGVSMIFLFDMGGVVANSSSMENICKELGVDEHSYRLFQLDSKGRNTYQQLSVGEITIADYWDNFSANSKKEIKIDYFNKFYNPVLNKSLILLIKKIKEKNYRVVCGTNTIRSHFDVHRRLGNYDIFDFVYSSHLMGVKKPNIEFFKKVTKAEQLLAQNIFFVDDNQENIEAANKLGMKTHLFTSNEKLINTLSTEHVNLT